MTSGRFVEEIVESDGEDKEEDQEVPEGAREAAQEAKETYANDASAAADDQDEPMASGSNAEAEDRFTNDDHDAATEAENTDRGEDDHETGAPLTKVNLMALEASFCLDGDEPGGYIGVFLIKGLKTKWAYFENAEGRVNATRGPLEEDIICPTTGARTGRSPNLMPMGCPPSTTRSTGWYRVTRRSNPHIVLFTNMSDSSSSR